MRNSNQNDGNEFKHPFLPSMMLLAKRSTFVSQGFYISRYTSVTLFKIGGEFNMKFTSKLGKYLGAPIVADGRTVEMRKCTIS